VLFEVTLEAEAISREETETKKQKGDVIILRDVFKKIIIYAN
jgi:hypothetical protein